jgi:K+-transporting ATPase c subunit
LLSIWLTKCIWAKFYKEYASGTTNNGTSNNNLKNDIQKETSRADSNRLEQDVTFDYAGRPPSAASFNL